MPTSRSKISFNATSFAYSPTPPGDVSISDTASTSGVPQVRVPGPAGGGWVFPQLRHGRKVKQPYCNKVPRAKLPNGDS